jgi:replicative DNA helicase
MTDFLPPSDEAERALIGSILIAPEFYRECAAVLSGPEDFGPFQHWAHVWVAFGELDKLGKPIDSLTVMDALYRAKLNGVNASDLVDAARSVPHARNAVTYAERVAEVAGKRRLLDYCSQVSRLAQDDGLTFLDGLERARKVLDEIPVRHSGVVTLTEQFSQLYDEVEARRKDPKKVWGVPIGIQKIDEETGGQQKGELTIIAGEPKVGKSMFAAQVAYYGSTQGFQCGIYSLEMRAKQILRRQIAAISGVDSHNLRTGFISDSEWDKFVGSSAEMSKLPLFIVDDSSLTMEQIRADIYRRNKIRKVDLVVVDYIGLVNDREPDDNVRENNITKGLKRMADQEDVAVIGIHSVNKEGLNQTVPKLSSVSGPVKNVFNADNIVFFLNHIPNPGEQSNPKMRTLYFRAMRDCPGLHFVNLQYVLNRPAFEAVPDFPLPPQPDYEWQTRADA